MRQEGKVSLPAQGLSVQVLSHRSQMPGYGRDMQIQSRAPDGHHKAHFVEGSIKIHRLFQLHYQSPFS